MRILLLLLLTACGFTAELGLGPVPLSAGAAGSFSSVTDSGLTSTRIPFAGTSGLLQDASTLLYVAGTGITSDGGRFSGNTTFCSAVAAPQTLYFASTFTPVLQVIGTGANNSGIGQGRWSANSSGATHIFYKSRGTSIGTAGVVTTADVLGTIAAEGDDGTDAARSSAIVFSCTGTIGNNRMPGKITLQTGLDASGSTLTDALTVDSSQTVTAPNGNVVIALAGKGLQVKEGTNARMGNATLSSGSVTVSNTSVTASTRFILTPHGSTIAAVGISAVSNGTSFTIKSSSGSDANTVDWVLVEPAP